MVCSGDGNGIWESERCCDERKKQSRRGLSNQSSSIYLYSEPCINAQYSVLAGDEGSILHTNIPDRLQIANISPILKSSQAKLQEVETAAASPDRAPTLC